MTSWMSEVSDGQDELPPLTDAVTQALVAQHRSFLGFLEKRVESRAAAEEILQSAFVKSIEKRDQLQQDESAVAWFSLAHADNDELFMSRASKASSPGRHDAGKSASVSVAVPEKRVRMHVGEATPIGAPACVAGGTYAELPPDASLTRSTGENQPPAVASMRFGLPPTLARHSGFSPDAVRSCASTVPLPGIETYASLPDGSNETQ